jgi:hypothetical protein
METQQRTQRLCSEIQLFDLCELEACKHKEGRFCTEGTILERFEAIKEEDPEQYVAEELDEDEESEELDEAYDADDADDYGDEEL